jgi:RimJ/RimL family protein N-acetyltransferase
VQEKEIIGFGGIERQVWRERDVLNLYYRFTPGAWGRGYATELARTAVALARTHLSTWPVVARIRAKNIPSIRTAERAGLMRRPDLDTEHIVFALGWTPLG